MSSDAIPESPRPVRPHDLNALEDDIRELNTALRHLGSLSLEELIKIIRQPGWTTPAEYELVRGLVQQMRAQVTLTGDLRATLLRGAQLVGAKA